MSGSNNDNSSLNESIEAMKLSDNEKSELMQAASTMHKALADVVGEENLIANSWSTCDAETFSMRIGPNYNKLKLKGPSAKALYDFAGVDFVKCSKRIDDFGAQVNIPDEWKAINTHHEKIPPVFIVNAQLPSDFSTSFFTEITDGDGWSLVMYYVCSQETADAFADLSTASPPVKLFANYCINAPDAYHKASSLLGASGSNPWVGRFKITTRCENIEKFGLPSFITAYNAKPVLIRHTGVLIRGNGYIEMDINIHRFASIPKKALSSLFHRFDQMIISIGFCIESREENEMPEVLFGCCTLNKPTYSIASNWDQVKLGGGMKASSVSAKN